MRNKKVTLFEDFNRRQTEVNFRSADWLSYLRTQLNVFVGRVCFSLNFSRLLLSLSLSPET